MYVAVKGGETAIAHSLDLIADKRRGDRGVTELSLEQIDQQLGTDALSILTSLGADRYRLVVENTSPIGSINGFTWSPPSGWTVTAVTANSGAGMGIGSGRMNSLLCGK